MDHVFDRKLSDAEIEAQIADLQMQISGALREIKSERERGERVAEESSRLVASNTLMLQEIGQILHGSRD